MIPVSRMSTLVRYPLTNLAACGTVHVGKTPIPEMGFFAMIADPYLIAVVGRDDVVMECRSRGAPVIAARQTHRLVDLDQPPLR